MNIYFSGLGGVGIGPMALVARDAGYHVSGSDLNVSRYTELMREQDIEVSIGQTREDIAAAHAKNPIDWFVYTAALPEDSPELTFVRENSIKHSLRGPFLEHILQQNKLDLIAIAGTHGKTTATGMMVWALQQLGKSPSYAIGTNISYGPSGRYEPESPLFIYEADEYKQQFLELKPALSIVMSLEPDHPDSYPTAESYYEAFQKFASQSAQVIGWGDELSAASINQAQTQDKAVELTEFTLPGAHNRRNAWLIAAGISKLYPEIERADIVSALNSFPGTERRFEKLADNLFTDYGHHPTEIAAVLQMTSELSSDVTVIYQPHQNQRQHEIMNAGGYGNCFEAAAAVHWLPTYLSREDPNQATLTPEDLAASTSNPEVISPAVQDDELLKKIIAARENNSLVVLITAGDADQWLRENLAKIVA